MAEDTDSLEAKEASVLQNELKCPPCEEGLPMWMTTFSDLILLLLTFFVLLLSCAKTETAKYQAALGSIRGAFGGNVLRQGEVIEKGKSAEDMPVMMESKDFIRPFPIEFLTTEGFFDKHEFNRESEENLNLMRDDLKEFALDDAVSIHEMPEGVKARFKDKIYFEKGSVRVTSMADKVFNNLIKLLSKKNWTIFVEGHSSIGERSLDGKTDSFVLSSQRAAGVVKTLISRGVRPQKITTVFYGDSRPVKVNGKVNNILSRRVEFLIRKKDLSAPGFKVHGK
jgi:chemotaxis protein MotB